MAKCTKELGYFHETSSCYIIDMGTQSRSLDGTRRWTSTKFRCLVMYGRKIETCFKIRSFTNNRNKFELLFCYNEFLTCLLMLAKDFQGFTHQRTYSRFQNMCFANMHGQHRLWWSFTAQQIYYC